jgi:hypothetical protein
MATKQATQGPWRVAPIEPWQEYGMVVVYGSPEATRGNNKAHVANVWNGSTRDPEVAAANARLIAAAPELRDALRNVATLAYGEPPTLAQRKRIAALLASLDG